MTEEEKGTAYEVESIDAVQDDDPVVRDLKSEKFATMPDSQALDIALALQQIARGQQSLLANQDKMADELQKLRAKMAKYDEDAAKYAKNQEKFVQDVLDRAEKLKKAGTDKDKLIAKGSNEFSRAMAEARAKAAADRLKFEEELRTMPKVEVTSPGVIEIIAGPNGALIPTLFNETVRIKHRVWTLEPQVPTMVPIVVANELKRRAKSARMGAELRAAMDGHLQTNEMDAKIKEIHHKYGETVKVAGEAEE